jgi:hypothetical protein
MPTDYTLREIKRIHEYLLNALEALVRSQTNRR